MSGDDETVRAFVTARRDAQGLSAWPGTLPQALDEAYRLQSEMQAAWGKPLGGVKVGRVLGIWGERFGVDRFCGPVCADAIQPMIAGKTALFPVMSGGTALLECEIIAVLGQDAPDHEDISPEVARGLVAAVHIGIEIAGSPMADINALGPLASIACFGNNNGVILGPAIACWQTLDLVSIHCVARIEGEEVGRGDGTRLPGGIWTAVAFACAQQARLGQPLKAGSIVCTGALTGMHPIEVGQRAQADFGPLGHVDCIAVAQEPCRPADQD